MERAALAYVDVVRARALPGLRLVLTQGGPGPWSEAAKYFFQTKRVPFTQVAQTAGTEDGELRAWTGQTAAPAAALDAEPPVSRLEDILFLAERCAATPALLPADARGRAWTLGLCREISGQEGKIEAFIDLMRPYGILELARTGRIALVRGLTPGGNVP